MRVFSWHHGRAWFADAPDALPTTIQWAPRTDTRQQLVLPATARGVAASVVVQRMCQTASGGSFFARIGATLAPQEGDALTVTLTLADDPDMGYVLPAVIAGIEATPADERPSGHVAFDRFVIHPVDLKLWAWRNAAAIALRLLCADVAALDDEAVASLAQAYAVGLPVWSR